MTTWPITSRSTTATPARRTSNATPATMLHSTAIVLTGRVLEMVERITTALNDGTGGAWSVTGPYGSGKSSLGVFLAALFGDHEAETHTSALDLIATVDSRLADDVAAARARFEQPRLPRRTRHSTIRADHPHHHPGVAACRAPDVRQDTGGTDVPRDQAPRGSTRRHRQHRPTPHRTVAGLTARRRRRTCTTRPATPRRR